MTQLGFIINLDSCMDLRGCMTGCRKYNNLPVGVYNVECFTNIAGKYPDSAGYTIPIPCQQCSNPSCVPSCPKNALVKNKNGVIVVEDVSVCVECEGKPCLASCPYGAIRADKATGLVYKCDMCEGLLEQDKLPACVGGCLTNAWYFGDFDDAESLVAKTILDYPEEFRFQLRPETGNRPNVHYLLSRKPWNDMNGLYSQNWHDE